jgi:hypothetical protein
MVGIGTSIATFGGSHTIKDNYFGGTAANCGGTALTKRYKEAALHVMQIYPSGGTTSIQNNTIKNISWSNDYYPTSMIGINIPGGNGNVNITGNTIGDNSTNGSITFIAKGPLDVSATMISIVTTGVVNCQNNIIGSITAQHQTTGRYINVTAIIKNSSAGTTTISNNVIGSLTTANSIYSYNTVAAGTNQSVTGISFFGTGTGSVNNNTIANLSNNTTTGNLYAINMNGNGSTATVNGNLIHSNIVTGATTAKVNGIWCGLGENTVTNNIVKLGDNNSYEIRGIGDSGTGNVNMYHNTVYLDGAPTTLALNSACLFSLGTTNTRNYKNNILVNARSNSGATGIHYALNMTENSGGTIAVDGNDYFVSGTDGKLGIYGITESISSPQIVTNNDVASVSVNPTFANAGGTLALDYKASNSLLAGVSGTGVVADYDVTSRLLPVMGAYESGVITPAIGAAAIATAFATTYGTASTAQIFTVSGINLTADLTATAPSGFEVSNGGVSYGSSVTFPQSGGSASGTLYIRLATNAGVIGTYNSQNTALSSTGATSVNITSSVSGNAITAKELTITADNQTVEYGRAAETVTVAGTYTPTGFVNGENESVISGSAIYSTTFNNTTPVGTSGITITPILAGLSAANYSFTAVDGTITISPITGIDNTLKGNNLNGVGMLMVNGNLTILNISPLSTVRVFDALGRMVISKTATSNVMDIKLNTRGIYTVQIQNGTSISTRKVIF